MVAPISVFLADDNLLVRAGVRALLGRQDDVDVVGEAAGYPELLKDRPAEGDQLAEAVRAVATGATAIDPVIVDALVRPVTQTADDPTAADEDLLTQIAEGRPMKPIAPPRETTPEAVEQ